MDIGSLPSRSSLGSGIILIIQTKGRCGKKKIKKNKKEKPIYQCLGGIKRKELNRSSHLNERTTSRYEKGFLEI